MRGDSHEPRVAPPHVILVSIKHDVPHASCRLSHAERFTTCAPSGAECYMMYGPDERSIRCSRSTCLLASQTRRMKADPLGVHCEVSGTSLEELATLMKKLGEEIAEAQASSGASFSLAWRIRLRARKQRREVSCSARTPRSAVHSPHSTVNSPLHSLALNRTTLDPMLREAQIAETQVAIKKASQQREGENAEFQSVVADQRQMQTTRL